MGTTSNLKMKDNKKYQAIQQIIELQLEHLFKGPKVQRAAIVSSPVPISIKVYRKPTGK